MSESSRQSLLLLLIFIFRQAFAVERLVGRRERLSERGKRTMTGRATDFDAALTGGLGEWPRKSAGGAGKSG